MNQVCLVTGGSRGIGYAIAEALLARGDAVGISGTSAHGVERAAATLAAHPEASDRVLPIVSDVRDRASVDAALAAIAQRFGGLDVLVNNAGVGILATVEQTTPAEFERLVRVNYLGAVEAVLAALPHMRRQGAGHIVNVASVVGKRASPFRAAYVASKFALVGFSEALRMELRGTGIDVTCVCPIGTATEFHELEPNRLGVPGRGGPIQSAEHVARAIVRALRRPRAEVHPYPPARLLFLANALAPALVDRLLLRLSPRARAR
jgi:NAD(P)-dependent dehydrogenase (short-subunit alcohol dehydrogenase family)